MTISGCAAVYYDGTPATQYLMWDEDRLGFVAERIKPGAFRGILSRRPDVRCLINHSPDKLLGRTTSGTLKLFESARGLEFEAVAPDTEEARQWVESIRRRDVSGCSFSFSADPVGGVSYYADRGIDVRELTDFMSLYDVGPVVFPAYAGTSVACGASRCSQREVVRPCRPSDDMQKRVMQLRVNYLKRLLKVNDV